MNEIISQMKPGVSCTIHSKTWQISTMLIEQLIEKEIEANANKVIILDTLGHLSHNKSLTDKCENISIIEFMYDTKNFRDIEKPVMVDISANSLTDKDIDIVLTKLSEYTGHLGKNKIFITSLKSWNNNLGKLMNNMALVTVAEITSDNLDNEESRYQNILFKGFIYGEYKNGGVTKNFDLFSTKPDENTAGTNKETNVNEG